MEFALCYLEFTILCVVLDWQLGFIILRMKWVTVCFMLTIYSHAASAFGALLRHFPFHFPVTIDHRKLNPISIVIFCIINCFILFVILCSFYLIMFYYFSYTFALSNHKLLSGLLHYLWVKYDLTEDGNCDIEIWRRITLTKMNLLSESKYYETKISLETKKCLLKSL